MKRKIRIVIADDSEQMRRNMRRILELEEGIEIVGEAANGEEAIALMDRKPDVVLIDIVMPVMDGIETTSRIKRLGPETIVILTTAHQNNEFQVRSMQAGADGFVLKDDLTTEVLREILNDIRPGCQPRPMNIGNDVSLNHE